MTKSRYLSPILAGALAVSAFTPASARGVFLKPAPAGCLIIDEDDGTLTTSNRCDNYFMIAFCVREEGAGYDRLYMRSSIVPYGEDNFSPFTLSTVKFTYRLLAGQLTDEAEWDPKC